MVSESDVIHILNNNISYNSINNISKVDEGFNLSYKVNADDESYFVKFGKSDTAYSIRLEYKIYNMLSNIIPVPDMYNTGFVKNNEYLIGEWINDVSTKYNMTNSEPYIAQKMGQYLAKIHSQNVPTGHLYVDDDLEINSNSDNWNEFFINILVEFAQDVKDKYPSLGSDIMELVYWGDYPEITDSVLTPIDYHGGNVLFKSSNVEAIIDFERTYGGDPRMSYEISKRLFNNIGLDKHFENGYTEVRDVPKPDEYYTLFALCREIRMAHMVFDDINDKISTYRNEICDLKTQFKGKIN